MSQSLVKSLCELPEYSQVLGNLIARDLKVKYQGKVLGFLWSMLHPAALIAIWYVVFHRIVRIDLPDYWAFLICGIIPFQFILTGVPEAAGAVRRNAGIIRKVYVPMEILVIASATAKFIEFAVQMAVAVAVLALLHHGDVVQFSWKAFIVAPAAMLLLYFLLLGISLPLSGWTVIWRDLDHIVSLVLMMLLYLTPVFWDLRTMVTDPFWQRILAINPMTNLLELFRGPMYRGEWPSNVAVGGGAAATWGVAIAYTMIIFVGGYLLFNRSKRLLVEVV